MSHKQPLDSFADLEPGDVLTQTTTVRKLLVLSVREGGGKHLGIISECGTYVSGIPDLFYWNEELGEPTTHDKFTIVGWRNETLVEKRAELKLAEKFASLCCDDDYRQAYADLKPEDADARKAFDVLYYSMADEACIIVAALKAIGVAITDQQAASFIAAMTGYLLQPEVDYFVEEATEFHSFGGIFPPKNDSDSGP